MNSTELFISAGDAISIWQRHHNSACILLVKDGKVKCERATVTKYGRNNPLYVSLFEVERGMQQARWTSIGNALHNLYCKELACQTHHKH